MWSALDSDSGTICSKSPKDILSLFEPYLTERQKLELATMEEIWYFTLDKGQEATKRGGIGNHGYDDIENNYIPVEHEHFNYRFELGRKIGKGGQGVVVRCLDHKTQTLVALKILAFPISKSLQQELLDIGERYIEEEVLKSYTRGIVRFLTYTKSRDIVHADIKPGNVLLKSNLKRLVRVTDFGYSFFVDQQPSFIGGTTSYKAPEVLLGYPATCAADMWSLGCTVARLAIGRRLFVRKPKNGQVACCIEILGMPPERMVKEAPNSESYFDEFGNPRWMSNKLPGSVPLDYVMRGFGAQLVSFVKSCLQVETEKPLSSSSSFSLLDHIYGEQLKVVEEEVEEEVKEEEKEREETEKDEDKDKDGNEEEDKHEEEDTTETSQNEPSRSQPTSANMWSALTSGSAIIRSKSPKAILALFEPHLTERQKLELTTMNEIWYFTLDDGEEETSRGGIRNHGYDDQEHNYIPVEHEHFNYRFELGRKIGQGGQGVVVQCLDHKTQTLVALKILASPTHFKDEAYQMMELRMSMELQTVRSDVDYNVANVMDIFYFRGHKCIVMELLKKSLHQVLIDMGQWRIDEDDLRSYARGIVRFLAYTKSRGIVHGDIKPGNVLLKNNSSSVVRVTDFGFSFFVDQQTSFIGGTLPYMAPEVVLGYPATCAADMWSLGCTVAKLVIRKELFVSDMNNDHVACCIEILGMPPKRMVKKAPRRASFFDPFGKPHWPSRTRLPGSVPLDHVLQGCGAQLVSFVKCCLQWDPKLRMTPDQALAHGWLQSKDTATTPSWDTHSTDTPTTATVTPTKATAIPTTTTATPTRATATPTTTTATPTTATATPTTITAIPTTTTATPTTTTATPTKATATPTMTTATPTKATATPTKATATPTMTTATPTRATATPTKATATPTTTTATPTTTTATHTTTTATPTKATATPTKATATATPTTTTATPTTTTPTPTKATATPTTTTATPTTTTATPTKATATPTTTTATPTTTTATPTKATATPTTTTATPTTTTATPTTTTATPTTTTATPTKATAIPTTTTATPTTTTATPTTTTATPTTTTATPTTTTATPTTTTATPTRANATPTRATATPTRANATPTRANATPTRANSTPTTTTATPTRANATPTRANATLTRANATPTRANATTTRANATPTRANATSTRANATPTRANATSTRANATPTRANTTSTRANATSTRANATSTRANATPTRANATPTRANATSTRANATSTRANTTPTRANATSTRANTTSTRATATPTRANATPTRANATSTRANATSTTTTATPTRANATPTRTNATPTRATATPTRATATPTRATATPTRANATPTRANATPTRANATPTRATATPTRANATRANATPTRANATPTRATATPTRATATPIRANSTPTRANATPTRANATPTRANATTGRANATTTIAPTTTSESTTTTAGDLQASKAAEPRVKTEEKPLSSSFSLLDHIDGERLKLVEEEVKEEKEGDETEKDEDKDKEEKDKDGNEEKDKYGNEEEDKHRKEEDTTEVEKTKEEIEEEEENTEEEKEKTEEEVEEVQQPQENKKHGGLARMGKTLHSHRSLIRHMVLCGGQATAQ
ncbi:unnamed protein product [Lampetra fluviatilis]